jgi:hypothetical protein
MTAKWVQYKTFSGYIVRGGPKFDHPVNPALHIDRAVYIAGQLEAANWGTVQGYDGAGMSGGILHNIAVSPKDLSQGSFFTLLARVFSAAPAVSSEVIANLKIVGWHVSPDGVLRNADGLKVPGRDIRNEFSGPEGQVPATGPISKAQKWAERFHKLFVSPATWSAQSNYAAEWIAGGNKIDEHMVYDYFGRGPKLDSVISLPSAALPPEVDLAMCVYHAFSVNAPAIAAKCLDGVKYVGQTADQFALAIIKSLGTSKYGNWQDQPHSIGNRYDRTRRAVWAREDLWPVTMTRHLMPTDL